MSNLTTEALKEATLKYLFEKMTDDENPPSDPLVNSAINFLKNFHDDTPLRSVQDSHLLQKYGNTPHEEMT